MTPDSTGARLLALLQEACGMLKVLDRYAQHQVVTDFLNRAEPLLLVSESHQQEHIDADDLRAAGNACDAQGNIHDRQQLEEGHAGPPWRGREWHELAQKFIKASDRGQRVTESHPSDRLRELIEEVRQVSVYAERCTAYGPADALRSHISKAVGLADELDGVLVRASQPSEGWQPISTVPRTGTECIGGWDALGIVDVIWWSHLEQRLQWSDSDEGDALPTHWQPLPAPPSLVRVIAETTRAYTPSELDNELDVRDAELAALASPAVEQGRLQALRYDLNREVYTMEQARALIARCRAALSVEAPAAKG